MGNSAFNTQAPLSLTGVEGTGIAATSRGQGAAFTETRIASTEDSLPEGILGY